MNSFNSLGLARKRRKETIHTYTHTECMKQKAESNNFMHTNTCIHTYNMHACMHSDLQTDIYTFTHRSWYQEWGVAVIDLTMLLFGRMWIWGLWIWKAVECFNW